MRKALKYIALAAGAGVLLLIGVLAFLIVTVDPNDYKGEITDLVKEKTGRELIVEGDMKFSVYPWLALELGPVRLSNAPGFGDEPFAQVDRARVSVKLVPLLGKQLEMETISLQGLVLNLARNADGKSNWADMTASAGAPPPEPSQAPSATPEPAAGQTRPPLTGLLIGGVQLRDSRIVWSDQTARMHLTLSDLNLSIGRISPGKPFETSLDFNLASKKPNVGGHVNLQGTFALDLDRERYDARNLLLKATLQGEPPLPQTPTDLSLAGSLELDLAEQVAKVTGLAVNVLGLDVKGDVEGLKILTEPTLKGSLKIAEFNPRPLVKTFGLALPAGMQQTALTRLASEFAFEASPSSVSLENLAVQLDDTTLSGSLAVADAGPMRIDFNLASNGIDLDRYLPPGTATPPSTNPGPSKNPGPAAKPGSKAKSKPTAKSGSSVKPNPAAKADSSEKPEPAAARASSESPAVSLAPLRRLELNGSLTVARVKLRGLVCEDIRLKASTRDGFVQVQPLSARLYGATSSTSVVLDARSDVLKFSLDQSLQGLQLGQLMQDLSGKPLSGGTLDLKAIIVGTGQTTEQLVSSLDGKVTLKAGQFNPREVLAALGQTPPATTDPKVLTRAELNTVVDLDGGTFNVTTLALKLDDTTVNGTASLKTAGSPLIAFDLKADVLDLDRYLPPPAKRSQPAGKAATPQGKAQPGQSRAAAAGNLPVDALRALDLKGRFSIGKLKMSNIQATQVVVSLSAKDGLIEIAPLTATLFGGKSETRASVDVRGKTPQLKVDQTLSGLQAEPLLTALAGESRLAGTLNLKANINASGSDSDTLLRTSGGNARLVIRNGAYKGVNIAKMVRNALDTLKGSPPIGENRTETTDFAELSGTFNIKQGVAHNSDLSLKSPLLRVSGKGQTNLVAQHTDYLLSVAVVGTLKGQGGKNLVDLKSISVPIRVQGPFSNLKYSLDMKAVLEQVAKEKLEQAAGKIEEQVKGGLEKKVGDLKKGVTEAPLKLLPKDNKLKLPNPLKGLFGK